MISISGLQHIANYVIKINRRSAVDFVSPIYLKKQKYSFNFDRIRKALENKSNMEDDRVAILEAQLAQAKLIAEEADKKYEEVE